MSKTKVLLVDDEADFLEIMGLRIRGWGYELVTAVSGEGALRLI
jgi:CheY-like chemotaxis protein